MKSEPPLLMGQSVPNKTWHPEVVDASGTTFVDSFVLFVSFVVTRTIPPHFPSFAFFFASRSAASASTPSGSSRNASRHPVQQT